MAKKIFKYIGLTVLAGMLWGFKDYILEGCIMMILIPARIFMSFGTTEDFGNGYVLFTDEGVLCGQKDDLRIYIPWKVEKYESNHRFIVARQHPGTYDTFEEHIIYPSGRDTTYYWIIDKDNDRIYGPVLYSRFRQLGDSLDIRLKMAQPDVELTFPEQLSNLFLYPHGERIPIW